VTWEEFDRYYHHVNHSRSAARADVDGVTRPSQPHEAPDGTLQGWPTRGHPVVNVKWHAAVAYCEWLSRMTGQRFRLPTEAEWEYACRAGRAGPAPEPPGEEAWYEANSGGRTHPVGSKKPNAFGLCDLSGNVWEHCLESYDPPGFGSIVRGGAWCSPALDLRFANRQKALRAWSERDSKDPKSFWWFSDAPFVGFRVVRFADPAGEAKVRAYLAKVDVGGVSVSHDGKGFGRVAGQVVNRGDRVLAEVELTVHYVDREGKAVWLGPDLGPAFTKCYPVLVNSAWPGPREPLRPGEGRAFQADVPRPRDSYGPLDLDRVAVAVSAVTFTKE
jgi:hypothetical protein